MTVKGVLPSKKKTEEQTLDADESQGFKSFINSGNNLKSISPAIETVDPVSIKAWIG